jgi:mxaK protein
MVNNTKTINIILALLLLIGVVGTSYQAYQYYKVSQINAVIAQGQLVTDEAYPYLQKFTAAYDQGEKKDYKHAVQTYGQLLDTKPDLADQAKIHYNIANNLFVFGLIRRINEDGTLQDEARYAYTQAQMAYQQSLRIAPDNRTTKFNLSLLHSVMANNMKPAPKDQSTMELSNLPIGLP